MLKSMNIKLDNKIKIYEIYVQPNLLYNCQTWSSSESDLKSLEIFEKNISGILPKPQNKLKLKT